MSYKRFLSEGFFAALRMTGGAPTARVWRAGEEEFALESGNLKFERKRRTKTHPNYQRRAEKKYILSLWLDKVLKEIGFTAEGAEGRR